MFRSSAFDSLTPLLPFTQAPAQYQITFTPLYYRNLIELSESNEDSAFEIDGCEELPHLSRQLHLSQNVNHSYYIKLQQQSIDFLSGILSSYHMRQFNSIEEVTALVVKRKHGLDTYLSDPKNRRKLNSPDVARMMLNYCLFLALSHLTSLRLKGIR